MKGYILIWVQDKHSFLCKLTIVLFFEGFSETLNSLESFRLQNAQMVKHFYSIKSKQTHKIWANMVRKEIL